MESLPLLLSAGEGARRYMGVVVVAVLLYFTVTRVASTEWRATAESELDDRIRVCAHALHAITP